MELRLPGGDGTITLADGADATQYLENGWTKVGADEPEDDESDDLPDKPKPAAKSTAKAKTAK